MLYLIKKHQTKIKNIFSYTENVRLDWIKNLTYGLAVIWVVVLLVTFSQFLFDLFIFQYAGAFIYITVVGFVFSIGYFGFKQTSLFTDYNNKKTTEITQPSKRYEKSGLSKDEALVIRASLAQLLNEEKPYLEGSLSLNQMADQLKISRHQLSQVINEHLGLSFFDLINKHRVDEFIRRVEQGDTEKFTLLGIAFDCGFNSKASFNRIFKIKKGMTPSAFVSGTKSQAN
jgi:AraC-like DNA-binding protein